MDEPPQRVTLETLAAGPAGELSRKTFLRLMELIYRRGRDGPGKRAYVASLSPELRMLWATYLLDNEVFNGGLEQYFLNSSRYCTAEALDGLSLLGADSHTVVLLIAAIDTVRSAVGGDLRFDHPRWRERYASVQVPTLQTLTRQYWDLPLLEPLQAAYIQTSPAQFNTE